ncbi:DUF2948 family protein [Yoonia sp. MH D7]
MSDARFEDGGDKPLRLKALDVEDLTVLSSLAQDAVFPASEMKWDRKARRFALLINRFRWEDAPMAGTRKRPVERVQAVLSIEDVVSVQTQGVHPGDADTIHSLLAVTFEPGADGTGRVVLTLSGDGAIGLDVEALEIMLRDVTRPYIAPSRKTPVHD